MHFDFSAFLVLATALTGLIWALDAFLWAPGRSSDSKEPVIIEYARSFFPIILVVLLLRSFLVEPFRIPSGSMMPTLLVGDFILVNKFTYGLRLPVLNTKLTEGELPKRGDVVVFRYPKDESVDYIKRVVGIPGDRVGYFNKVVHINGQPMTQNTLGKYQGVGAGTNMTGASERVEDLSGVEHAILVREGYPGVQGEFIVPEGKYFVMGDNRDNSNDSRYWGPVDESNLVGKAFLIWMNWDSGVDFDRVGTSIQ